MATLGGTSLVNAQTYVPPDLYGDAYQGNEVLRRNDGQVFDTDGNPRPDVKYYMEGAPLNIWLRDSSRVSFSYTLLHNDSLTPDTAYRVDMSLRGAKMVAPAVLDSAPGIANYYRGSTTAELVPAFHRGVYANIKANIDLHLYGSSGGPRLALVLHPGADTSLLKLTFTGQDSLHIDWLGALRMYVQDHWLELKQGVAYQVDSAGNTIPVNWQPTYAHQAGTSQVGFNFGSFDPALPLVVEIGYGPMALGGGVPDLRNLDWSTYMGGGGGDELTCVQTDNEGNPYSCGNTWSNNFPVDPGNELFPPFDQSFAGMADAVVMKFQASNKQLAWATYYGGSTSSTPGNFARTEARKLAVYNGLSSNLQYTFVVGTTDCTDFLPWAWSQSVFSGAVHEAFTGGIHRMWVGAFKKSNGTRDWATTHGESTTHTWQEEGLCIGLGPNGELAVGGRLFGNSTTPNFPSVTPANAYVQTAGGGFVMLFNPDFTIRWCSPFGGYLNELPYTQVTDLCFTPTSSNTSKLWITGRTEYNSNTGFFFTPPPGSGFFQSYGDIFLGSFDVPSLHLDYCTSWGDEGIGYGLDFDGKNLWVVGGTEAAELSAAQSPVPSGEGIYHQTVNTGSGLWQTCDGFILAFKPLTYELKYGTLIGGSKYDMLTDVGHDGSRVYITGETRSTTVFATDLDPNRYFQDLNTNVTSRDAVILALDKDISSPIMRWRTAFGGTLSERGWGIAASQAEVFLVGATASQFTDAFPLKEFDPISTDDFYQEFNFGGTGFSFLEFYDFDFGLNYEHYVFGEAEPEPLGQDYDGFIASFSSIYQVGVEEPRHPELALMAVPLPVQGQWSIHFPHAGNWSVAAYNPAGQQVGTWQAIRTNLVVDLAAQAPGIYLLTATTPDGEGYSTKIYRP